MKEMKKKKNAAVKVGDAAEWYIKSKDKTIKGKITDFSDEYVTITSGGTNYRIPMDKFIAQRDGVTNDQDTGEKKKNANHINFGRAVEIATEYLEMGSKDEWVIRKLMDYGSISYDEANRAVIKAKSQGDLRVNSDPGTGEKKNAKYDYNNPEHRALRDKVAKDMLGKKWSECSPMEMDRVLKEVEKTNNQNIGEKKNANQDEVAILKEITNWLNHSADEDEIVKRLMGKYRNLSRKECEKLYRKASDQWEV
jgi:hypothetical protein